MRFEEDECELYEDVRWWGQHLELLNADRRLPIVLYDGTHEKCEMYPDALGVQQESVALSMGASWILKGSYGMYFFPSQAWLYVGFSRARLQQCR